jgi:hypothetical protein
MSSTSSYRAWQATLRRQEREAARALKEIEKQRREQAKQSDLEQARFEVEAYEGLIAVLLSTHRECTPSVNWTELAAQLLAPMPARSRKNELEAYAQILSDRAALKNADALLIAARERDAVDRITAHRAYLDAEEMRASRAKLAQRVLRGEVAAAEEAVSAIDPFAEITSAGIGVRMKVHDSGMGECWVDAKGPEVLPGESKSLTASGKLSVKPMPRGQAHELFQDYICSCVLRVGREMFAILPCASVLVHATAPVFDPAIGYNERRTVISVRFERARFAGLNFERIDPSDAVDAFGARSDFKTSRKSGAFVPVEPLTDGTDTENRAAGETLAGLMKRARALRGELIMPAS